MTDERKQEIQSFVDRLNSGATLVANSNEWKLNDIAIKLHLLMIGVRIEDMKVLPNPYVEPGKLLAFNLKPFKYPMDFKFEFEPEPLPVTKEFSWLLNIGA